MRFCRHEYEDRQCHHPSVVKEEGYTDWCAEGPGCPLQEPDIEKAPTEAATSEQGAREINQDQNNTVKKDCQIPPEILLELAAMQTRFKEICREYRIAGIDDSTGIHLADAAFFATFPEYEFMPFNSGNYKEEFYTTLYGARFFCIR